MAKIILSSDKKSLLLNALTVAAEKFDKNAEAFREVAETGGNPMVSVKGALHLAQEFDRQAKETRELWQEAMDAEIVINPEPDEAEQALAEVARELYDEPGEVEVDELAQVSLSEGIAGELKGAYVSAWIYVDSEDMPRAMRKTLAKRLKDARKTRLEA
jgi:hypothetical protein